MTITGGPHRALQGHRELQCNKELPELNDDFAKDIRRYQTLDELKDSIRSICMSANTEPRTGTNSRLSPELVDTHPFAVPDAFVDRQIEGTLNTQLQQLASRRASVRARSS